MSDKYYSLFIPNKQISAFQYILEILIKNKTKDVEVSLPIEFYKLPEWKNYYLSQTKKLSEYLKNYHPDILITVISKKKIYSLYPKWVDEEFKKEHNRILNITETILSEPDIKQTRITKSKGKQSKDLDLEKFNE